MLPLSNEAAVLERVLQGILELRPNFPETVDRSAEPLLNWLADQWDETAGPMETLEAIETAISAAACE